MANEEEIEWDYRSEINKPIVGGTLLLSEPFMKDPSFIRSVCLIANHNKEDGAFGFIMNKKTSHKLSDLIEINGIFDFDVYYGGPVATDSLFFVHNNATPIPETLPINENLSWNGNFEVLIEKINQGEILAENIRFFIGYSGWGYQQLRKEIIENSWIINNNEKINILKPNKELWKDCLQQMQGVYQQFAQFPIDPTLN